LRGFDDEEKPLFKMLNDSPKPGHELNEPAVREFVDVELSGYYQTIISTIHARVKNIPIVIHAYDHPVTQPGGFQLQRIFELRGIADLQVSKRVMKQLIDRLNDMVADHAKANPHVHHAKLTGTLQQDPALWRDELHATEEGFDRLARVLKKKLDGLNL
jgi:hypothetical protein